MEKIIRDGAGEASHNRTIIVLANTKETRAGLSREVEGCAGA